MAKNTMKDDLAKVEASLNTAIKENKKVMDSTITGLIIRISKLEKDMEAHHKEKEEWAREKARMEEDRRKELETWAKEREEMKDEMATLRGKIASLTPEEGEIHTDTKEAIKEELTKVLTASMEDKLEATKKGWVEVVKKNIKREAKEEAQKGELLIVHTTLEEEKMRHARRLNIRVTGIGEKRDSTPEMDGRELCTKLGYQEGESPPFTKAWRAGKDLTKKRPLILQFPSEETRTTFLRKRMIL